MQDSVENCEKKWNNFKQAYSKEKNFQELESRSGSGASHRKNWIHFDAMKQLFSTNNSRQSYSNISQTDKVNTNKSLQKFSRKRKSTNPVEATLNKIHSTITSVVQREMNDNNVSAKNDNVDVLTGKMIEARLSQMSPRTAKKIRKRLKKCIIDSDSDNE